MNNDEANIRELFLVNSPEKKLSDQIISVIKIMVLITVVLAVFAILFGTIKNVFAVLAGGASQIIVAWTYGQLAGTNVLLPPKEMLSKHLVAEATKVVLSLALLIIGLAFLSDSASWFVGAYIAALAAYWFALLFGINTK
jgi:ATP synthase protein I